jgi:hypothetical protein
MGGRGGRPGRGGTPWDAPGRHCWDGCWAGGVRWPSAARCRSESASTPPPRHA